MASIFFTGEKLSKQDALNSLTLKIEEYFSGRFAVCAVSDDGGPILEVQVEVPNPPVGLLDQAPDFPLDEVMPKWAGWRMVVTKVPPTYIDIITNAEEIDDY